MQSKAGRLRARRRPTLSVSRGNSKYNAIEVFPALFARGCWAKTRGRPMKEEEWLCCSNPVLLWKHYWLVVRSRRVVTRKPRLLACAAARRIWHLLSEAG